MNYLLPIGNSGGKSLRLGGGVCYLETAPTIRKGLTVELVPYYERTRHQVVKELTLLVSTSQMVDEAHKHKLLLEMELLGAEKVAHTFVDADLW